MLVAVCDHSTGTTTSRCSKITEPLSFPIEAVRVSHWTSSYGVLPDSNLVVKYRGNEIPVLFFLVAWGFKDSIFALRSTANCPISFSSSGIPYGWERLRNSAPIYSVRSRILSPYSVLGLRGIGSEDYKIVVKR